MNENTKGTLEAAVLHLLRPLVRILLRYGIPYQGFAEMAKTAYVDVARDEFALPGRKMSQSRISVLTGLTRKDVHQRTKGNRPSLDELSARTQRAATVLSGWLRDPEFTGPDGEPMPLIPDGDGVTFHALVRRYGRDAPHRAVLDELVRVGAVEYDADGRVLPSERGYVPTGGTPERLGMLGTDPADLINTIDHNLHDDGEPRYLQRKVTYDDIPSEHLDRLRQFATERGVNLLTELDPVLAASDREINASVRGTGRNRVVVGIYYWQERNGTGPDTGTTSNGEGDAQEGNLDGG